MKRAATWIVWGSVGSALTWVTPAAAEVPEEAHFFEPGLLYVNFDGAPIHFCAGSDDPRTNCSTVTDSDVLPYPGDAAERAALLQIVSVDMAPFAVEVVDERPPDDLIYDMVAVGNWDPPPEDGSFVGVAPEYDCWDSTPGQTSFTLHYGNTASVLARVVAQEAAHTWGLEHVDAGTDLMHPNGGTIPDPTFEDTCHTIVTGAAVCRAMHALHCPDDEIGQNSYLDLLARFGPREADVEGPALEITSPKEGESLPSGSGFELALTVTDSLPPPVFHLYFALDIDEQGSQLGTFDGAEHSFAVAELPDGQHTIRVDAEDMASNVSTDEVTFWIGPVPEPGGTSGGEDPAPASSGEPGGEPEGSSDGAETPDAGSSPSQAGCGCAASPFPAAPGLFGLLLARRRRPRKLEPTR